MRKIPCKPVTFGGSTKPGSPYSKFKEAIMRDYKGAYFETKENLSVEIVLYLESSRVRENHNDLDNFLKPIIDALQEKGVLREVYIGKIIIERVLVKNKEGVDIVVHKYEKYEQPRR